ncbi:cell division protein ZapA [Comamonas sp. GB3 AK4-5]|uniref:cell division protein ZapA n=1 Tax=Comamonas sp. GB3 AK4-5 TaxID=3231487 RepID=UPI00351E5A16
MSQIEARILQQDYLLTCPDGQEAPLLAAVDRVDAEMERIRNTGKVRSRERVGVLVAVNLAFENAALSERVQALEQELDLNLESTPTALPATETTHSDEDTPALMTELQALLAQRELELLQAQHLIARMEAALDVESQLL